MIIGLEATQFSFLYIEEFNPHHKTQSKNFHLFNTITYIPFI